MPFLLKDKMKLLGTKANTFKKKGIKDSKMNTNFQRLAEKSLGSTNLRQVVKLPEGEDLNEWLAYNVIDSFNKVQMCYEMFSQFCTKKSCPVMNAGPKYEYKWADRVKIKKPISCSAPEYVDYLLNWVQDLLEDETIFPQEDGVDFPKNFINIVKDIFRRLFRVYAHLYYEHSKDIEQENAQAHLNTSLRHFIFFVEEFDLIEKKQLEPLLPLIQEWDNKYPKI